MQKLARTSTDGAAPVADVRPMESAPPLYASRKTIHPKAVNGRYRRIKWAALVVLLALYYVLPWIRWDRGPGVPDQAVLFDLENQRFYLFAVELWPQQIYYFTGAMILGAVGLFLATALAGRVWCGYACPQTVWTDLFVLVEQWVEGDRGARIRLDNGPRDTGWLLKKAVKHGAWLLIGLATGGVAIFYFVDAPTLLGELLRVEASALAVGWILFFTLSTYAMAGFMREQMCVYVCPWPRFQAAMLDEESLVVTYQDWRGEGRAPVRKDQGWDARKARGKGDCIDCNACVHVCPTGIDIRDGIQMDCISCGLCIDACNDVMTRIGRPQDLIRYDTQAAQAAKAAGQVPAPYRLVRSRTIVYALILVTVTGMMAAGLLLKPAADVAVLRDRAPLFVTLADGDVRNSYTLKVSNMTRQPQSYRLSLSGIPGAVVTGAGVEALDGGRLLLTAQPDAVESVRVHVRVRPDALAAASTKVTFTLTPTREGATLDAGTVFIAR
ncbi:cytochrome c oxidase accessory protein CcoG [Azospirillum sp. sgz301742]